MHVCIGKWTESIFHLMQKIPHSEIVLRYIIRVHLMGFFIFYFDIKISLFLKAFVNIADGNISNGEKNPMNSIKPNKNQIMNQYL